MVVIRCQTTTDCHLFFHEAVELSPIIYRSRSMSDGKFSGKERGEWSENSENRDGWVHGVSGNENGREMVEKDGAAGLEWFVHNWVD